MMELKADGLPMPLRRPETPDNGVQIILDRPRADDGPKVTRLIAASPPLDTNSPYCNLLQCSDFAGTCVIARRGEDVVGWLSAYRAPADPGRLFVWQVAVSEKARGEGLAGRMLQELVGRAEVSGASSLSTTITAGNEASWALFEAFARAQGATISRRPRFDRDVHFSGAQGTEWEATIAPIHTSKEVNA